MARAQGWCHGAPGTAGPAAEAGPCPADTLQADGATRAGAAWQSLRESVFGKVHMCHVLNVTE